LTEDLQPIPPIYLLGSGLAPPLPSSFRQFPCGDDQRGQLRRDVAGDAERSIRPALAPLFPVGHHCAMAARSSPGVPHGTSDAQRSCARAELCEAKTRDTEGIWHPAKTYQPFCIACTSRVSTCAAEFPSLYGLLATGGAARQGRRVHTPPGPRIHVNVTVDALLRESSAVLGGWAARVRAVPGLSLAHSGHPHGSAERVHDDCKVLALHPAPLLALPKGPTVRSYPWPLEEQEEARLGTCEIVRIGADWVHVIEPLEGMAAGLEILALHYRARRLAGQVPAPPDLLDGVPCRSCEAMSSLEVIPAPPPDPEKPPPAFCRCSMSGCGDEMSRREYDDWVKRYESWTRGAGVLTCRRCQLGNCPECVFISCQCRSAGHRKAA
jgi:hypothetical protein